MGGAECGRAGNSQGGAEGLGLGLMKGLESCRRNRLHASSQQEIITERRDSIFQCFLLESSHGCWFESRLEPGGGWQEEAGICLVCTRQWQLEQPLWGIRTLEVPCM